MSTESELERLKKQAARERRARKQAEHLLEARSRELFASNQALTRLNDSLEQRVEDRTNELCAARDEAMEGTRAKSEFLAVMSHEIRTPLNGVLGTLELLEDSALGIEQRELISIAKGSGKLLLAVINDILDMSKIEAGRIELEEIPFSLHDLMDEVLVSQTPAVQNRDIEIFLDVDASVPAALIGDPVRIRQVLSNLISNAAKFTDSGEIVATAATRGGQTVCSVTDTGIGISDEQAEKLFKPFMQADSSTTRRYGGTGLGLTICKALVETMGGTIEMRSQIGAGTNFTFTLPLGRASEPRHGLEPSVFSGGRALIVDASPTFVRLTSQMLRSWGFVIEQANTPAEMLARLVVAHNNGRHFSFAIVSAALEDKYGNAVNQIRAHPTLGALPVIATTANGSIDEVAHANVTLSKPLRRRQLHRGLQRVLGIPRSTPEDDKEAATRQQPIPAHVLLAEDDSTNRLVALGMFKKLGLVPDIALNGREAVEAASRHRYDIIFMDGQMPIMDGFAATATIREAEREAGHAPVPIVALTASALQEDRERCEAVGMDDFLSKPVSRQALGEKLFKFVRDRRGRAAEADTPVTQPPTGATILPWRGRPHSDIT